MFRFVVHRAFFVFLCLTAVPVRPAHAEISWIIHVTPPDAAIQTEIILRSNTYNPGTYLDGTGFTTLYFFGELVLTPGEDFAGPSFFVSHSKNVNVWVRYSGPSLIAPLTLPAQSQTYNYFRFENPGAELGWKGLVFQHNAIGDDQVRLVFRDQHGFIVKQQNYRIPLTTGKLAQLLPEPEDDYAYFEIFTEQPIRALLLSGTKPVDGKYMLNHHLPVITETNHLNFSWLDETGQRRELQVAKYSICTDTGSCVGANSTFHTEILEKIQELKVFEIGATVLPLTAIEREVDLFWFGRENLFSYSGGQEDVPAAARQFTDLLIQIYEEILLESESGE